MASEAQVGIKRISHILCGFCIKRDGEKIGGYNAYRA